MSQHFVITDPADGAEFKRLGEEYVAMTEIALALAKTEGFTPKWAAADSAAGLALRRRREIELKYSS